MKPYVTPPHAGKFQHGDASRLEAIVGRMNKIIDRFMGTDATHVFINDGDVETPPNCIDTLLRHNVDVASGVYPYKSRSVPEGTMVFGRMIPDNPCGKFTLHRWSDIKGQVFGATHPWSGGAGCMLIKRRVFKRHHPKLSPLRFTRDTPDRTKCSLDTYFWKRIQDAGFTARVDTNILCGHLPDYPLRNINEW